MRLIFIRHGEPDYSIDSLTEKGWKEAGLLAERVKKWDISEIYCSPMGRARDTASDSLRALGREAVICPWLEEFVHMVKDPVTGKDRIPWDFMPDYWTRVPQMFDREEWVDAPVMAEGGIREAFEDVKQGIDGILAKHGYHRREALYLVDGTADREATLVFFCHMGVTMTILSHLLGIAQPLLTHGFFLAPASVTVVQTEEREQGKAIFRVQAMGDTRHLADGGEPVSGAGYFTEPFQG